MARSKRKDTKRREANRRLPIQSLFDFALRIPDKRVKLAYPGVPLHVKQSPGWEPSSRLKNTLKEQSRSTKVDQTPAPKHSKPSKPYTQPNWSSVDPKKIEQPTLCEERSTRKQVMFATNKAGKTGQKTPVWTEKSRKKC